jgi:hypothetical protein
VGPSQNLGFDQLAALDQLLMKGLVVVEVGRDLLRLPLVHRRLDDASLEVHSQ